VDGKVERDSRVRYQFHWDERVMFVEELALGMVMDGTVAAAGVVNSCCEVEEDVDEGDGVDLGFTLHLNVNFGLGATEAWRFSSFSPKVFNCYKKQSF
jgi:hypothetical protein